MKYLLGILFLITIVAKGQNSVFTRDEIKSMFNNNGEIVFRFQIADTTLIPLLSTMISIDKVTDNEVVAYANEEEFYQFTTLEIPFQIIPPRILSPEEMNMLHEVNLRGITAWDFYPTYSAYLSMMEQFATQYPTLCEVFSIGTSVQGRQLMMAKISDNVGTKEAEPQFLYTGTIHGDELTGYVLLLRLIDYLLTNYGTNPKVTNLVNNLEIWINPLANPDGTYYGGNNTVANARRFNANNVDINRNFPDPEDGPHPDGKAWQPETLAFMQLAQENHFVMSANTHGGAEVMNYPWDTWARLAADNSWWIFVSRQYVDTVHLYSPSNYFDGFNNGITNGYAWYTISGGRQDYMNYFHNCRELTLEISDIKKPTASNLPNYWNWNFRSLLNYMEQCTFGISGTVTNLATGAPIKAKILIEGHDLDNSFVYSDSITGLYQRLLDSGTYNLTFIADGFPSKTIGDVSVNRYSTTLLNVQLGNEAMIASFSASQTMVPEGGQVIFTNQSSGSPAAYGWFFEGGTPAISTLANPPAITYPNQGIYDVKLTVYNASGDSSQYLGIDFIHVFPEILMGNGNLQTCNGLFYDSGGEAGNYASNESYSLTFTAPFPGSGLVVDFLEFDLENETNCNKDWLKIFDGASISSPLIGKYCGTVSPGVVHATNAEGALTFQFSSDNSITKPGWKAHVWCNGTQTVQLKAGWNGISAFIESENSELTSLFGDILSEIIMIQGEDGTFIPENQNNTLQQWDCEKGYQIKLFSDALVSFDGIYKNGGSINLFEGWNLIPVLCHESVPVSNLISGIENQVIIIKESAGLKVFWPDAGINTLQSVLPGNSYFIKVSAPILLTYPE